jgi:predicted transcriptional regulator
MRNGHHPLPPLRPELQAALDEMNAKGDYFAYAVCRTWDGQAWEVNTREGGICSALDGRYLDHDEAMAAGVAWLLAQLAREPTADEAAYRALWEAAGFSR